MATLPKVRYWLFIFEGKNVSILSALHQGKFLNCHIIINKTLRGTFINNLMLSILSKKKDK